MTKKLLQMQKFLKDIGLEARINECDKKLYLLDIEDKYETIIKKSNELDIIFTMERKPCWGTPDPVTLKRDIVDYIRTYYFEDKEVENNE